MVPTFLKVISRVLRSSERILRVLTDLKVMLDRIFIHLMALDLLFYVIPVSGLLEGQLLVLINIFEQVCFKDGYLTRALFVRGLIGVLREVGLVQRTSRAVVLDVLCDVLLVDLHYALLNLLDVLIQIVNEVLVL